MKKLLAFSTALMFVITAYPQVVNISNVRAMNIKNVSAITENEEVKGYVSFYFVDKENRKENNYKLNIYDNNLNLKFDIDLIKPSNISYIEGAYNGTAFCYSFFDPKTKTLDYIVYDKEGKKKGSYLSPELSKMELAYMEQKLKQPENPFAGVLVGIPSVGFARYGLDDDKGRAAVIEMIDNDGKKAWSKTIKGDDDNDYVFAMPLAYSKDVLATLIYTRESLFKQEFKKTIIKCQNTADGSDLFKFDCKGKKYQYSPTGVSIEGDKILLFGEYFKPTDNTIKENSQGLFIIEFDNTGKMVRESYQSWKENINKTIPSTGQQKLDARMKIAVHDIVKTADGSYFVICEQFMRVADGAGIAMNIIGGGYGSAMTKIESFSMMVMQFNADFVIQKTEIFEKNKTSIELMPGLDMYGTTFIAYYLKATGQFDYSFTTISPDKKIFNVGYVNYDRKKEGGIYTIGNLAYNKEQKLVHDKLELKTKPTVFIALPGKPGYVAVMEYFKKEKKATIRLEKLNI